MMRRARARSSTISMRRAEKPPICYVGLAADKVEGADADGVAGIGVSNAPGAGGPEAHDLEKGDDGGLVPAADDGGWGEDEVVGAGADGVGEGAAEGVRAEEDVGVGEEEEVRGGERGGLGHSVRFAEPAFGEGVDPNFRQVRAGVVIHHETGAVRAAVVDGDDVEVGVILGQEGVEAGFDVCLLVACGDYDSKGGEAGGDEVVGGESEIGQGGEAARCGEDAGEPGGGKEPGDDGADCVCKRHVPPPVL